MAAYLTDSWHGCYREGWGRNRLRPASFAHPAKCSYGLSKRIYEHAIEEGWVKPGDYLIDIFAGVGGFALEAMRHGLNFVGVELEQRFCDMGQGCDCTGISKADWVRFQGRWDKARYQDGRHWCPECIMKAAVVAGEREFKVAKKRKIKPLPLPGTKWGTLAKTRQASIFDIVPSASYVRNSGKIPCTGPHHYRGNIETWEAQGMSGTARIVQGDSRRLGEVLERARLCLSSPPYANSMSSKESGIDWTQCRREDGTLRDMSREPAQARRPGAGGEMRYSDSPANLGNLPDTGFEAAMAAPKTVEFKTRQVANHYPGAKAACETWLAGSLWGNPIIFSPGNIHVYGVWARDWSRCFVQFTNKKIVIVKPMSKVVLAVASPGYCGSEMSDNRSKDNAFLRGEGRSDDRKPSRGDLTPRYRVYSKTDGQLAQMSEGSFDLALSSPVYHSNTASDDPDKRGGLYRDTKRRNDKTLTATYSADEAQLAQMPERDLVLAISSPPFLAQSGGTNVTAKDGPLANASLLKRHSAGNQAAEGYGISDGQLAALPEGSHAEACERPQCCISSPPYAHDAEPHGDLRPNSKVFIERGYGRKQGQLAQMPPGDHAAALEAGAETGRAQACISSPPFEGSLNSTDIDFIRNRLTTGPSGSTKLRGAKGAISDGQIYGTTAGQLGQQQGSTFWAASRQILEEVYSILAPSAHAIWVLKAFIRSGRLVDFPGQWEALCQSVGFKTVCKHRAWMNKDAGVVQVTLDGEEMSMEKWYKSFFRILTEKRGSPRIDFEIVLCMVKE